MPKQRISANQVSTGTSANGQVLTSNGTAANWIDYYTTGTWTPAVAGDGGSFSSSYTYRLGTYTKIGNQVIAPFIIRTAGAAGSGLTGNFNISVSSLPFSPNIPAGGNVNLYYFTSQIGLNTMATTASYLACYSNNGGFYFYTNTGVVIATSAATGNSVSGTLIYQTI